jgi:hypothetical protein
MKGGRKMKSPTTHKFIFYDKSDQILGIVTGPIAKLEEALAQLDGSPDYEILSVETDNNNSLTVVKVTRDK